MNTELAQDWWASGRLYSRGFADRRKQSLECGGGGNLLMGLGKSQNHKCSNSQSVRRYLRTLEPYQP